MEHSHERANHPKGHEKRKPSCFAEGLGWRLVFHDSCRIAWPERFSSPLPSVMRWTTSASEERADPHLQHGDELLLEPGMVLEPRLVAR